MHGRAGAGPLLGRVHPEPPTNRPLALCPASSQLPMGQPIPSAVCSRARPRRSGAMPRRTLWTRSTASDVPPPVGYVHRTATADVAGRRFSSPAGVRRSTCMRPTSRGAGAPPAHRAGHSDGPGRGGCLRCGSSPTRSRCTRGRRPRSCRVSAGAAGGSNERFGFEPWTVNGCGRMASPALQGSSTAPERSRLSRSRGPTSPSGKALVERHCSRGLARGIRRTTAR